MFALGLGDWRCPPGVLAERTFLFAGFSTGRTFLVTGEAVRTFRSTNVPTVRTKGRFVRTVGKVVDGKVDPTGGAAPRSARCGRGRHYR